MIVKSKKKDLKNSSKIKKMLNFRQINKQNKIKINKIY